MNWSRNGPAPPSAGRGTFRTIEDYPLTERHRSRTLDNAIAEPTVIGGVPDIAGRCASECW